MEVGIALVAGVVIGWLVEWVIDWQYWRRGIAGFYATESQLRTALDKAEGDRQASDAVIQQLRNELGSTRAQLQAAKFKESELQRRLDTAVAESEKLKLRPDPAVMETRAQPVVADRRDDLERIDGIGPVYEKRLFDAGITTYADLAARSPDELQAIIQPAAWQNLNYEGWIKEAREFAEVVVVDQLPYRLEEIRGIGPTYVKRLNAAGITTFAQLSEFNEKQLAELIKPAAWQKVDFSGWVRQARAFAALVAGDRPPLPLEAIRGIGPVSATRLELAGIRTFADLANTPVADLRDIIGRNSDAYKDWVAQAKERVAAGPTAADIAEEA